MRNPGGYAFIVNAGQPSLAKLDSPRARPEMLCEGTTELDSFTCYHCGSIKHVRPKEDPATLGGLCKICMKLICGSCVDKGHCDPLEKKLERAEKRDIALRSYGF